MSEGFVPISVEYIITTTSDWTTFQIFEGGLWSNHQVKCGEGCDSLTQELLYNEKTILISKRQRDETRIVVHLKCTLNIIKEYIQSNMTYLITKGDVQSTVVRVIAEGKEIITPLVNATKVPNNPRNPLSFNVPAKLYLQALEEKKEVEKVKEKPKEKVELIKEELHVIVKTFNELFEKTFKKKEPTKEDIEEIFEWLRSHGENATKMLEADIYRDLTLETEKRFWECTNIKKKLKKEAKKTLKKIRERYDDLRKIQGKFAVQTPYLGGIEKEEQKIAPKE